MRLNNGLIIKGEHRSLKTEYKKGTSRELHPRWKGGKPKCVCGKLISYKATSCNLHAVKKSGPLGPRKNYKYKWRCGDCYIRVYPNSKLCKKCSVKRRVGNKASNWKGGITPLNKSIRSSKEYVLWRIAVFMRDNYTCQKCFKRGTELQADHIKPFALYPELRLAINNGRTLCISCHRQTDTFAGRINSYAKITAH